MAENAFDALDERGFFYQHTDADALRQRLAHAAVTFYVGFDPTADSLHVGHLLPIMGMRLLQHHGHRPIALVGGATALVGDPSGKTEARRMLTREQVHANAEAIRAQLQRFIHFDEGGASLVNNADWLDGLAYIDFLREVGRHFSVNRMLTAESVKQRLETGLSFLEFNYMLLQAYDFAQLYGHYGCEFQFGGQDQWGNIVAGIDLTRRLHASETYGATFPLLTDAAGKKFGKTEDGAVWLSAEHTPPFDYYQFWRNVADADVARMLGYFTTLPMEEVRRLGALPPPRVNRAKEILAFEATRLAHGEQEAARCYLAAARQFGFADPEQQIPTSSAITAVAGGDAELPTVPVAPGRLAEGIWICQLLHDAELASSNSDARRKVQGGGVYLNDTKVADHTRTVTRADFNADGLAQLRVGKKNVKRLRIGE